MIALGDEVAPGASHRGGLVDAEHALDGAHGEHDGPVRIDLEQHIGAGEGKTEESGGVVSQGRPTR